MSAERPHPTIDKHSAAGREPVVGQTDLLRRRAVDASRRKLGLIDIPPEMTRRLRRHADALVRQITSDIRQQVTAYSGTPEGRRHQLVAAAVHEAVHHFLDIAENRVTLTTDVYGRFRWIGHGEAEAGHDLDGLQAAYHVAAQRARRSLHDIAQREQISSILLGPLVNALYAYLEQLLEQVVLGYRATPHSARSTRTREQLVNLILSGANTALIERMALSIEWDMPARVVVAVAEFEDEDPSTAQAVLPGTLLSRKAGSRLLLISGENEEELLRSACASLEARVALTWAVATDSTADAYRWAGLALDLVARGVITGSRWVECAAYRPLLWLHADPRLGEHLHQELLAPLLTLKPHYRAAMMQTMLLWLRTRSSARVLARELGVHEQTVRNRLRDLHALFGPALQDPRTVVSLLMALEASVLVPEPRRVPGDHGDE